MRYNILMWKPHLPYLPWSFLSWSKFTFFWRSSVSLWSMIFSVTCREPKYMNFVYFKMIFVPKYMVKVFTIIVAHNNVLTNTLLAWLFTEIPDWLFAIPLRNLSVTSYGHCFTKCFSAFVFCEFCAGVFLFTLPFKALWIWVFYTSYWCNGKTLFDKKSQCIWYKIQS